MFFADEPPERHPNLTLASGLAATKRKTSKGSSSDKRVRKGYWGDVVTGPFLPYGFQYSTEVQVNGQKKFRERQERLKCFNFQMTKTKVERLSQSRALRWVTDLLKEVWNKVRGEEEASSSTWLPKVTFLSVATAEKELLERNKFAGKFSSVFVACSVTHFLQVKKKSIFFFCCCCCR